MAEIPSTPIDGNLRAVLVPAVADVDAPTVAELTAVGAVDISCYLTGDGLNITVDEAVITDERLCSRQTFEQPGRQSTAVETTYIDNTNSVANSASNAAREALDEGAVHYLVTRRNLPYEDAFAAAQVVRVYPIKAGVPREVPAEANSVTRTVQKQFVTGKVGIDVAVAA